MYNTNKGSAPSDSPLTPAPPRPLQCSNLQKSCNLDVHVRYKLVQQHNAQTILTILMARVKMVIITKIRDDTPK